MKATGIVRRIDDLGRIVIPKELRRKLHIQISITNKGFIPLFFICTFTKILV